MAIKVLASNFAKRRLKELREQAFRVEPGSSFQQLIGRPAWEWARALMLRNEV